MAGAGKRRSAAKKRTPSRRRESRASPASTQEDAEEQSSSSSRESAQEETTEEGTEKKKEEEKEKEEKEDFVPTAEALDAGLPLRVLVRNLRATHEYLARQEQGGAAAGALGGVAAALAARALVRSADGDVRLLAACCLADVVRVFAPEPPYDEAALRAVFALFLEQLRGVGEQDGARYALHYFLVERLAAVKAFVLLLDLGADLVDELFATVYDVVAAGAVAPHAEALLLDIVAACVDEADALDAACLDAVLLPLTLPARREAPRACAFSRRLVQRCPARIGAELVALYRHDAVAVAAVANDNDNMDDDDNNNDTAAAATEAAAAAAAAAAAESDAAEKVHELVYEIHKVEPRAIAGVFPLLADELREEDDARRLAAVQLFARMFAAAGSTLAAENRAVYSAFTTRFADKSAAVRTEMLSFAWHYLTADSGSGSGARRTDPALVAEVLARTHDPEESVRAAAVACVGHLLRAPGGDAADVVTDAQLRDVLDRLRDKKPAVRADTLALLTDLLGSALAAADVAAHTDSEGGSGSEAGTALLHALPARYRTLTNRLLGAYTLGFDEDRRAALAALVAVLTRQRYAAADGTDSEDAPSPADGGDDDDSSSSSSNGEFRRTSPWSTPRRRSSAAGTATPRAGSSGGSSGVSDACRWCTGVVEMLVAALDDRAELALHTVLRDQCVARAAFLALCDAQRRGDAGARAAAEERLVAAAALGALPRERVHAFFAQLLGSPDATVQAFVARLRTLCTSLDFDECQRALRALGRNRAKLPALLARRGRRDAHGVLVCVSTLARACAAHLLVGPRLVARALAAHADGTPAAARALAYCVAAARLHPAVAAPHLATVVAALRESCSVLQAHSTADKDEDVDEDEADEAVAQRCERDAERLLAVLGCRAAEGLAAREPALFAEARGVLVALVADGAAPALAKRAVATLAVLAAGEPPAATFGALCQRLTDALDEAAPRLPVLLQGLGCIARALRDSTAFDRLADGAVVFVTDRLLRRRPTPAPAAGADAPAADAPDEHRVAACAAGAKFLARYLATNTTSLAEVSSPIIAQLVLLATARRDAAESAGAEGEEAVHDACLEDSRVRCAAAGALLRLARCAQYDRLFTPALLQLLAGLARDGDARVRAAFERKLAKGLGALRLPLRYLALLALYAAEPRRDVYSAARAHLQQCVALRRRAVREQQQALARTSSTATATSSEEGTEAAAAAARQRRERLLHLQLPEYALPYAMSLLAHDSGFAAADYLYPARCLHQLVAALAHGSDDFAFLAQLVGFVQSTEDARVPPRTQNLRVACEIVRRVLARVGESRAWKDTAAPPGDIFLPPQYFRAPTATSASASAAAAPPVGLIIADYEVYAAPPEFTSSGDTAAGAGAGGTAVAAGETHRRARPQSARSTAGTPARKRARTSAPARTRTRPRARRVVDDDDENEDEEEQGTSSDDEVYVARTSRRDRGSSSSSSSSTAGVHPRLRPRRTDISYVEDDLNDETFAASRRRRPSSAAAVAVLKSAARDSSSSSSSSDSEDEDRDEDEERAQSAPAPRQRRTRSRK